MGLATFFGFISSSCSFAALSTTRALFAKGAGLVPALSFLLSSTNLVIELGIVIGVFLSWQFVVGEYLGGLLLIGLMWLLVRVTLPKKLEDGARQRARDEQQGDGGQVSDWRKLIVSLDGWKKVGQRYAMEWNMVWKDVTVGFTVAGAIAAFVPKSFFQTLFVGSGSQDPSVGQVLAQTLVGPVAAFFTFIGSMGNIPLAAVLFVNGVSFAGIMAFIFSDLVVFPVLRIQAKYYGWKMALYILAVFLAVLVTAALILHYGFAAFDALPASDSARSVTDREYFKVDYTLFLNIAFALLSAVFFTWKIRGGSGQAMQHDQGMQHDHGMQHDQGMQHDPEHQHQMRASDDGQGHGDDPSGHQHSGVQHSGGGHEHHGGHHHGGGAGDKILLGCALASFVWLAGGVLAGLFNGS